MEFDPSMIDDLQQRLDDAERRADDLQKQIDELRDRPTGSTWTPVSSYDFDQIKHRIETLESTHEQPKPDPHEQPEPESLQVLMVQMDGTRQWHERAVVNGVIVDYVDGLKVTADADMGAVIPTTDEVFLLRLKDVGGYRYVQISGGGAGLTPQYQGQVLGAPVANSLAAIFPFAVNIV